MKKYLISKSLHGNSNELLILKHLEERYSNKYSIISHCRTWNLFEPRQLVIKDVIENCYPNRTEQNEVVKFLDTTEWDFVICTKDEDFVINPMLIIDYDGLCDGEIRDGQYVHRKPSPDPKRKKKYDTKIQISKDIGIPYIILPRIYDVEIEMDTDKSYVWLLDIILGTMLKEAIILTRTV